MPPVPMANTLTYRINRNRLELSLWQQRRKNIFLSLSLVLLASQITLFTAAFHARHVSGWLSLTYLGLAFTLLAFGFLMLIPAMLWQRFGREIIELDPGHIRIYHDYRIFRILKVERSYREMQAQMFTDLGRRVDMARRWKPDNAVSSPSVGWLVISLDQERVRTRVALPRNELEEAVVLLDRYSQRHSGPGRNLYVVSNN